jgi:hypothetical protein
VNQFLNISSLPLPWRTWRTWRLIFFTHLLWHESLVLLHLIRYQGEGLNRQDAIGAESQASRQGYAFCGG